MNKKPKNSSRREFVKSSLKFAAFSIVPGYVLGGTNYVAPSDKINLGIIGCGKQSHWLSEAFMKNKNSKVIALSDVDSQKLEAVKNYVNRFYAGATGNADYNGTET